jgi:hypothetical protein
MRFSSICRQQRLVSFRPSAPAWRPGRDGQRTAAWLLGRGRKEAAFLCKAANRRGWKAPDRVCWAACAYAYTSRYRRCVLEQLDESCTASRRFAIYTVIRDWKKLRNGFPGRPHTPGPWVSRTRRRSSAGRRRFCSDATRPAQRATVATGQLCALSVRDRPPNGPRCEITYLQGGL